MERQESKFSNLPADMIYSIAAEMDYETTLKVCNGNKRIKNICKNNNFWMYKIEQQYPNVDISKYVKRGLTPETIFLLLESKALKTEANRLTNERLYIKDPEYVRLENERGEIGEQIEKLKRSMKKIASKQTDIQDRYMDTIDEISEKANRLAKLANSKFGMPEVFRYIVGPGAIKLKSNDFEKLQSVIKKKHPNDAPLSPGDLIGLYNVRNSTTPSILIYIYKRDDSFLLSFGELDSVNSEHESIFDMPKKLIGFMEKNKWNSKTLEEEYNLPFKLKYFDPKEKKEMVPKSEDE